ncbi:diguanylate cyclase [Devosia sp.]|uniref:diguanylate cyclase n=1 Tax=Devosia sp. TaxID=1871048 RepID=UPI0032643512
MVLGPRVRAAVFGAVMGLGAIASMLLSFEMQSGVFFDLRATLVAVSGLLGGPLAGMLTGAIVAAYRLYVGGGGAIAGALGIAISTGLGLLGYALLKRRPPSTLATLLFALIATPSSMVSVLALPTQLWGHVLDALPPTLIIGVLATFLAIRVIVISQQRAEEAMLFMAAADLSPDYAYIKNPQGRFFMVNKAVATANGFERTFDMRGKTDFDILPPENAGKFFAEEQELLRTGVGTFDHEEMVPDNDGNERWFTTSKTPLYNPRGDALGLVGVTRDITRQKAIDKELLDSRDQLSFLLTEMSDGLALFDREGRITYCNEQYRSMFPLTAELRVPGASLPVILRAAISRGEQLGISLDGVDAWIDTVMSALRTGQDEEVHRYDGRWLHVRTKPLDSGKASVVVSDITTIKLAETELRGLTDQLRLLATTDTLTGLPNRRALDEYLAKEISRTARSGQPISLVMIDIDRFKAFNDIYGHPTGDVCLKIVAEALRRTDSRRTDLIARYGGEEFCAILPDTDEDGAYILAEKLRAAVRDLQLKHEGSEKGVVTISVGIASYDAPTADRNAATLLARADEALYIAKGAGRDRVIGWAGR